MELLSILLMLLVLFALARIGNRLFELFGMPGLIGEIIVGIIIANVVIDGTSLLTILDVTIPEPGSDDAGPTYSILYTFAELGVIFLLFSVGLETKVGTLLSVGRTAMFVAGLGVLVPFVLGFAFIMAQEGEFNHAMFLGAAMVATSVGITARVIKDMHLMEKRESRIIVGAAVIDDVLGMIVLAIVKGIADSGDSGFEILDLVIIIIEACAFVLAIIAFAKYCVPRIHAWRQKQVEEYTEKTGKVPRGINDFILGIIVCLALAAFAEYIGLAAIIGAFLAGMLFADHAWETGMDKKVDTLTTFLISFFFLNVGLQVDLSAFTTVDIVIDVVVILALALISKFIGCGLGARLGEKMDGDSCKIIGVGMVPRGEVGIIVASIGLHIMVDGESALSPELYSVIVIMAVATTIIAPPILTKFFRKKYADDFADPSE